MQATSSQVSTISLRSPVPVDLASSAVPVNSAIRLSDKTEPQSSEHTHTLEARRRRGKRRLSR